MRKSEIRKLDYEVWNKKVKEKANYTCEFCGIRGVQMEAAHVVGRRYRGTRWGLYTDMVYDLCGHCFCHNCHQQYDEHGPLEDRIVEKGIGRERKVALQIYAKQFTSEQTKAQDFEQIKSILENL